MEVPLTRACACTKGLSVHGTSNDTKSTPPNQICLLKPVLVSPPLLAIRKDQASLRRVSTVVRCFALHSVGSLLVFSGEILVWDFREQDSLIARVLERQDLHRDSITSLQWIREPKLSKKKFIVSVSVSADNCWRENSVSSSRPVKMERFSSGIHCRAKAI